jgi:hypothetical protein
MRLRPVVSVNTCRIADRGAGDADGMPLGWSFTWSPYKVDGAVDSLRQ